MLYVVLLAAAGAASGSRATEGIEGKSPKFHRITTAGRSGAKHTVPEFEKGRGFFMRKRSKGLTTRLPVTIVLFRNAKEFKPYSPNEVANAFYTGDQSRDFIVMSSGTEEERPIAVHEYVHLLVRNMELKLPLWLNEGL